MCACVCGWCVWVCVCGGTCGCVGMCMWVGVGVHKTRAGNVLGGLWISFMSVTPKLYFPVEALAK